MIRGGGALRGHLPERRAADQREIARLQRIVDEIVGGGGRMRGCGPKPSIASRILRYAQPDRNTLNPSVDLWRQLIQAGYPFLKRELLLRNPTRVTDIFEWEEVVSEVLHADPQPLADDIRRSLGARLPEIWSPVAKEPAERSETTA